MGSTVPNQTSGIDPLSVPLSLSLSLSLKDLCLLDDNILGGCPRGVMVKAMDTGIVVSEFVFQSRYYVLFRANTLGKGMKAYILPAIG